MTLPLPTPPQGVQEASLDAFRAWLLHGVTEGWVSVPVCAVHDTVPTRAAERAAPDACIYVTRVW